MKANKHNPEAHAALGRLCARGYTAFRNGRIAAPDKYVHSDEDRSDFEIVKTTFPHSRLI